MGIYQRDPAAPGANVRHRRVEPAGNRLEDALSRFNTSQAARTVTGLSRSLGRPRISIGAAAGSPSQVRITVAWELCWYQWGVDCADGRVFEIGKGSEVAQLDWSARQWNGTVGEGMQLTFGGPGRPPRGRLPWLRRR